MKSFLKIVPALFLLNSLLAYSQDTLYFNSSGDKIKTAVLADYYQTLVKENVGSKKLIERSYYMNGQMREEIYYLDLSKKKKEGTQRFWFRNGQLKISSDWVDNKLHGTVLTYWQNGQLKRSDTFENDKLVSGTCYDSIGQPVPHFDFRVLPIFPGGENKLLDFIRYNLKYPSQAAEKGISGKVVIKFIISKEGIPIKIGIKTGVDRDLDLEALRVIKAMPKWTPFYLDGEALDFQYYIPVVYKLQTNNNDFQFPTNR